MLISSTIQNSRGEVQKNLSNQKKHGIAFEDAIFVFSDLEHLSIPDLDHSEEEERWVTIGAVGLYSIHKGEKMKKQYNFSKGIKGKFYISEEEIQLPLYLDKKNQDFYTKLAKKQNRSLSEVINILLSKEKDLLSQFIP
jgi:hypothetical protein